MTSLSERLLAALDARDADLDIWSTVVLNHGRSSEDIDVANRERRWVALGRHILARAVEAGARLHRREGRRPRPAGDAMTAYREREFRDDV